MLSYQGRGTQLLSLSKCYSTTTAGMSNDSNSHICYMVCVLKRTLTIQCGMKDDGFKSACVFMFVCKRDAYTHSPEIQWQSKMRQQIQLKLKVSHEVTEGGIKT